MLRGQEKKKEAKKVEGDRKKRSVNRRREEKEDEPLLVAVKRHIWFWCSAMIVVVGRTTEFYLRICSITLREREREECHVI